MQLLLVLIVASIIGVHSETYVQLNTTGTGPVPLYWTACWIEGNSLAVFGGTSDASIATVTAAKYQSSIHYLDLTTKAWTTGASSAYPLVNIGDAVVTIGNNVYVWAGSTTTAPETGLSRLSAFTVYDTVTTNFTYSPKPVLEPYKTNPRGFASAEVTPNGGIAVFGGSQGTNKFFNDFYEFDIANQTWTNLNQANDTNIPSGRSGVATTVYKGKMYFFGGRIAAAVFSDVYAYDFTTGLWSLLNTTGTGPSARFASQNMLTSDGLWIIFGGAGNQANSYFNDTYYLNLNSLTWSTPTIDVLLLPPRTYSCGAQKGNTYYFFGGANNTATFNDVWSYTYTPPVVPTTASLGSASANTNTNTNATTPTSAQSGSTFDAPSSDAIRVFTGFAFLALAFFL